MAPNREFAHEQNRRAVADFQYQGWSERTRYFHNKPSSSQRMWLFKFVFCSIYHLAFIISPKDNCSSWEIGLCISALELQRVNSSVELIKSIDTNATHVKTINLKAMVAILHTCYETLMRTLDSTADIVLSWLEENRESISASWTFLISLQWSWWQRRKKSGTNQITKVN